MTGHCIIMVECNNTNSQKLLQFFYFCLRYLKKYIYDIWEMLCGAKYTDVFDLL